MLADNLIPPLSKSLNESQAFGFFPFINPSVVLNINFTFRCYSSFFQTLSFVPSPPDACYLRELNGIAIMMKQGRGGFMFVFLPPPPPIARTKKLLFGHCVTLYNFSKLSRMITRCIMYAAVLLSFCTRAYLPSKYLWIFHSSHVDGGEPD